MADKKEQPQNTTAADLVQGATGTDAGSIKNKTKLEWSLDDFEIRRRLSNDRKIGNVFLAREKKTRCVFALKLVLKAWSNSDNLLSELQKAAEIQSRLRHRHILRLYGYFHNERFVYLVMELAPRGELRNELANAKKFDDKKSATYIKQVCKALRYCHRKEVMHREINPDNILIGRRGLLKLADFGWPDRSLCSSCNGLRGTMDYWSPEMVENSVCDEKADLWALGILIYELLVGKPPFKSKSKQTTCDRIRCVDLRFPAHVSDDAKNLISRLLQKEPKERASLEEVMSHPWITKNAARMKNAGSTVVSKCSG